MSQMIKKKPKKQTKPEKNETNKQNKKQQQKKAAKNRTNKPGLVLSVERKLELQHSINKLNAEERALTATSFVQRITCFKINSNKGDETERRKLISHLQLR